jgi:hypothetical protein
VKSQVEDALVSGDGYVYLAEELRHGCPGVWHDDLEDSAGRAGHGQEPAQRLRRMVMQQLESAVVGAKLLA